MGRGTRELGHSVQCHASAIFKLAYKPPALISAFFPFRGKRNSIINPPVGEFSAFTCPPWSDTAFAAMERPRPTPPDDRSGESATPF
jgi:hypothetical protein